MNFTPNLTVNLPTRQNARPAGRSRLAAVSALLLATAAMTPFSGNAQPAPSNCRESQE